MTNRISNMQNAAPSRSGMHISTLEAYADDLNAMGFSRAQGILWFVNQREDPARPGGMIRFLDTKSAV